MEKICVLGLGYIGLPTAAKLASKGFSVVGVDIKKDVIQSLKEGRIHIEEPLLVQLVQQGITSGMLVPSESPVEADVYIIAVPTPKTQDNKCQLDYVVDAVNSIIPYLRKNNLIILESTVTPGTTEEVLKPLIEQSGLLIGRDLSLAHCPERVLPGSIIKEITMNNRIIGGYTQQCALRAENIYKSFVEGQLILTDLKTAEMTKLVENIFRDVNIAFANELVKVCDKLNIDTLKVIELANMHPRVNILKPGPGVGGHCLAIDPYYVISKVPEYAKLMSAAREINCSMPDYIASKVEQMLEGIHNPKVAVLGITYKENVDDVRESPSIEVIRLLKEKNYKIAICDPHVDAEKYQLSDINEAVRDADLTLILVAHEEFKRIDYDTLASSMRRPLIFDAKCLLCGNSYKNVVIRFLGQSVKKL